ncbi:protein hinderin isoform X1 [Ranitomeya imitator]|uniref:protein hinderin isoform X1 n=3 Tax=Ranitomeya imitator TaxID=111125 RepID=UPI0037E92B76
MADVAGEEAAAYWSQDESDVEQHMVYIPGLCSEGNYRPAPKTNISKATCANPGNIQSNPAARMDLLSGCGQNHYDPQVVQTEAGMRSASLKDLCPEDKRRIANLIKELARVSEEKEVTEERLKMEHESFEKKIRHLEEQNSLIATEREALQQQYRECQELLSLYQKYLSEQQEKLSPGSGRPQQVPKTPRRPTANELNGSYLAQQRPKASSESLRPIVPPPLCRSDPTPRNIYQYTSDRCSSETCLRSTCPGAQLPCMHYTDCPCSHRCSSALQQPVSHCCLHPTVPDGAGRIPPDTSQVRPPEDCSFSRFSTRSGTCTGERARMKDSAAGKAISEQRKQELLLQKLEVEIEKERLQQLLAQQEVKLLEKQQQLQQTRLEAERSRPHVETQNTAMAVMSTPLPGAVPSMNGSRFSPVSPTPPSSKSRRKQQSPSKNVSEVRASGLDVDGQEDWSSVRPQASISKECRKDAITSPVVKSPSSEMKTAGISLEHRYPYRYETSLIDMLEAISPISAARRRPKPREPHDLGILSPTPSGGSKPPARRREPPSVDPEERAMLEDIFFIC